MNIALITARLVHDPIRFFSSGNYFTEVQINFLHAKNYFANAIIIADSKIGDNISEFYCQGDYILIEGECIVVEAQNQNALLAIYATDVQPAHLIMQE